MRRGLRRGRRRGLPVNAEIQITNLVDVAFVLLIIFMITAPILQGGVELDLPDAEAQPLTDQESITVSIAQDGTIFLENNAFEDLQDFIGVYKGWQEEAKRPTNIRADRQAQAGLLLQVLAAINALGIEDVAFVLDPLEGNR